MSKAAIAGPDWIPDFLSTLAEKGVIKEAVEASGVTHGAIYFQRRRNADFAAAWEEALSASASPETSYDVVTISAPPRNAGWRPQFLAMLAETSNITLSAAAANVPLSTVYKTRRDDPAFALKWRHALYEGYEHLEMEVLAFLRGHLPDRKIDVANAIRQLAAHRKTVAEMRAIDAEEDEQEVLDSIDEMIDRMREQAAAAGKPVFPNG